MHGIQFIPVEAPKKACSDHVLKRVLADDEDHKYGSNFYI